MSDFKFPSSAHLPTFEAYRSMSAADRRRVQTYHARSNALYEEVKNQNLTPISETEQMLEQSQAQLQSLQARGVQNTTIYEKKIANLQAQVEADRQREQLTNSPAGKAIAKSFQGMREKLILGLGNAEAIEEFDAQVRVFFDELTTEPDFQSDAYATAIQPFIKCQLADTETKKKNAEQARATAEQAQIKAQNLATAAEQAEAQAQAEAEAQAEQPQVDQAQGDADAE